LTRESRPNGGAPGRSDLGENRSSHRWEHDPNSPDACTRGHDPNSPDARRRGHDPSFPDACTRGTCGVRMKPTFENVGHPPPFPPHGGAPGRSDLGKPNQPAPQHRVILHPSPAATSSSGRSAPISPTAPGHPAPITARRISRRHFLLMGVPQVVPTWVNPISPSHSTGSSCTHHRTPRARKAGDPARKSPAVIASMATRSVDSRSVDRVRKSPDAAPDPPRKSTAS
jgi:hypothetical protein